MKLKPKFSIAEHFASVEAPMIDRTKDHLLIDILTIAILAVIWGINIKREKIDHADPDSKWL